MRLLALVTTAAAFAIAGTAAAAPAMAESAKRLDTGFCSFDRGTTTCAATTVVTDVVPVTASAQNCTATRTDTITTTTYTAHRGEINSAGVQLPAPATSVVDKLGAPVEQCTAPAQPALVSSWSHQSDGVFFNYEGHNFAPNTPVAIQVTFTNADGSTQTFHHSLTTFSNGFFSTGEQFHCDYLSAVSVTVTQGNTVLTKAGTAADAGACTG